MQTLEFFQLIASGTTVIALIYTGFQIYLLRKVHRDNHEWNRRKSAQDLTIDIGSRISDYNDLSVAFNLFNRTEAIPLDEINTKFAENPSLELKVLEFLNLFNIMARGVIEGVYDEEIIYKARSTSMIKTFEALKQYIEKRKNERGIDIYSSIEALVNEWKNKNTLVKRRRITGQFG